LYKLDISYFAWVRERMGRGGEEVVVPDDIATVGALVRWLAARDAAGAAAFAEPARIRAAVDGAMVGHETLLSGARGVALFPPVTGG
jgi:sulfur-carrier protein